MPCGTIGWSSGYPGDGVAHAVRQVDPGVAKPDAGVGRGQEHVAARLVIAGVGDGAGDSAGHHLHGFRGPDVRDGIGALVSGAQTGVLGSGAIVVGQRGEGLHRVGEDIQSGTGRHHRRHGAGVVRVDDAQRRAQGAVGDPGLGVQCLVVEDRHPGRLRAGAGRGRDGDQRPQRPGDGGAFADRLVDVGQQRRGVRGIEIGRLGGVHDAAAADGHVAIEGAVGGEGGGVHEGGIGRFDADLVVEDRVDVLPPQGIEGSGDRLAHRQPGIGDDHDPARAEPRHVGADLPRGPRAELDGRSVHGEAGFVGRG
ncbi:MAG: hypothetical protein K0Q71_4686 [Thermomicrobiales bacterium]|nr:hypothetical protein [Thermomicrobiales bacterium]